MIESNYTFGFESDVGKLKENNGDHRTWSNPLEVQYVSFVVFNMKLTLGFPMPHR